MAAAQQRGRAERPWLVPVAAAAAVAALVAAATVVGLAATNGNDGQETSPAAREEVPRHPIP